MAQARDTGQYFVLALEPVHCKRPTVDAQGNTERYDPRMIEIAQLSPC